MLSRASPEGRTPLVATKAAKKMFAGKAALKKAAPKKSAPKKPALKKDNSAKSAFVAISRAHKAIKASEASEANEPPYNERTMKVIRDALAGKNLVRYATAEEMFEDLGI